jgi:peptidoglycan DL-endopeptidase CwlO
MARRVRLPLRIAAAAVTVASLSTASVFMGSPASVASVKNQIASAKQQLAQLDQQAETASNAYDAAVIKLTSAEESSTKANDALKSAQGKVIALQQKVSTFAAAAYRGDAPGLVEGLISDGSAGTFVSRLSTMQAVSASESQTLNAVSAAQRTEQQAQVNAGAALKDQKVATTSLQADRNQIIASANKEQSLLHGLVAKEQAIEKAAKDAAERRAAAAAAAALQARERATAAATQTVSQAPQTSTPPPAPVSGSGGASTAVQWAYNEIGKPYVWGAAGPDSFDCSGLTQYVWAKAGVYLGHYTGAQWNEGTHVSRDELEPGDLVFFVGSDGSESAPGHVGIYIGGNQMIDAPYTGVDVRIDPLQSDYVGAVRPG